MVRDTLAHSIHYHSEKKIMDPPSSRLREVLTCMAGLAARGAV